MLSARNTFWHRSGQCAANHVIDGGNVTDVLEYIKSKIASSDSLDEIMKSVQATFKKDPDVCAACGIFCDAHSSLAITSLPRDVFVLDAPSDMDTVHQSGPFAYRLYSDGIRVTDGEEVGLFCEECSNTQRRGNVSQFSLAGGLDFGKIPEFLQKLSLFERMAIARVRPFINLVKLTPTGGHRLDGHVISFEHDAVERLGAVLPHPDLRAAINVMFVGTPEDWRRKKADLLSGVYPELYSVFGVNSDKIEKSLRFLSYNNPHWADCAFSEENIRRLVESRDDILDHVEIASREGVDVNAVVTSDVANVRPHADNDEPFVQGGNNDTASALKSCAVEHVMVSSPAAPAESNVLNAINTLINGGNPIPVSRSSVPVNEFLVNDEAIYKMFPNLFPRGVGLVGKKTVSAAMVKHLLLFHDGRFAQELDFLFLLCNQMVRHETILNVSLKVSGKTEKREAIMEDLNSAAMKKQIQLAAEETTKAEEDAKKGIDTPLSAETRALLKKMSKHLRVGTQGLKHGPMVRERCLSELRALCTLYGLPSLFVTVAPSDRDNELVMRFCGKVDGDEFSIRIDKLSNKAVRNALVTSNPVFCATVFQKIFDVVVEKLYGLSMDRDGSRKSVVEELKLGIFGEMLAHYACVEAQGRGTLHFHQIIFTSLSPNLFEAALQHPDTVQALREAIDGMISFDVGVNNVGHHPESNRCNVVRPELKKELEDSWIARTMEVIPVFSTAPNFRDRAIVGALLANIHVHQKTCTKGAMGKRLKCRMGMALGAWPLPTGPISLSTSSTIPIRDADLARVYYKPKSALNFQSPHVIVWESHREPSQVYVSPFNKFLMNLVMSNQNVSLLGSPAQCRSAIYYVCSYCCKDSKVLTQALVCLNEALKHTEKYPSTHPEVNVLPEEIVRLQKDMTAEEKEIDDAKRIETARERSFKHVMQRWVNNVTARVETSSQQAAAMLLGDAPNQSSESFHWCFADSAVKYLREKQPRLFENFRPDGSIPDRPDDTDEERDADDNDDDGFYDDVWDGDDGEQRNADDGASETIVFREGHVSTVGQHMHFAYCPDKDTISLYEFSGILQVVNGSLEATDTGPTDRGIRGNGKISFIPGHGVAAMMKQYLQVRSKHCVPVLSGRVPPHPGPAPPTTPDNSTAWKLWRRRADTWAIFCIITFLPWNTDMVCLLQGGYPAFVKWSEKVIKDSEERTGDPIEGPIARARLGAMMNATQGLRARPLEKNLCSEFKYRNTDHFSKEEYASLSSGNGGVPRKRCSDAATTAELLRQIANMDMDSKESRLDPLSARVSSALSTMTGAGLGTKLAPVKIQLYTTTQQRVAETLSLFENASANTNPDLCANFAKAHKSALPRPADCDVETDDRSWRDPDGLNRGQHDILKKFMRLLGSDQKQILQVVQGGPGTGKTFLLNNFIEKCGLLTKKGAPTGIAASLISGRTLHSLFGFARSSNLDGIVREGSDCVAKKLAHLKVDFRGVRLLVIDEVSQLTAKLIDDIDKKLRLITGVRKPFGGLHVILCGDFVQLPPVSASPLYVTPGHMFPKFEVNVLAEQMRSKDVPHNGNIDVMRVMKEADPMSAFNFRLYENLKSTDFSSDDWSFATHVVTRNKLRRCINFEQAQRWAHVRSTPFVTWNVSVPSASSSASAVALELMWHRMPIDSNHLGVFAQDAPCFITSNLNPEIGLCNGTSAKMTGIGFFAAERQRELEDQIAAAHPGERIHLKSPPDFIVVEVGKGDAAIQVPITEGRDKVNIGNSERVCLRHMVDLGFACTYWKVQGRTLPAVVLHLSGMKKNTVFSMFLVGISRVQFANRVRLFPPTKEEMATVQTGLPNEHLREYMRRVSGLPVST